MGRNEKGISEINKFREYILMIFVTVGTHEQQFDRLVRYMDEYANKYKEDVVIQFGYSSDRCRYATAINFLSMDEMNKYIDKADVVITHGGPSSFLSVIQKDKKVIVVPRLEKFGEHVNNHQADFLKKISYKFKGMLFPVFDIEDLAEVINNLKNNQISLSDTDQKTTRHNSEFNERLQKIVSDLMEE